MSNAVGKALTAPSNAAYSVPLAGDTPLTLSLTGMITTVVGRVKPGAMSFARFSTDDTAGVMRGYVGEGDFTSDSLNTFGGVGVVKIANLQKLLHYICENGFEHHVAANFSTTAGAVYEAAVRYLGWKMHWHGNEA